MQSADDSLDRHIQHAFGGGEHALDPRVSAAADQHQAKVAHVDDKCLLGEPAGSTTNG
jgi:hypothetical protein